MNTTIKTSICGLLTILVIVIFASHSHAQIYSNYNNSMHIKGNAKVKDTLFVAGGFAVIGADTITPGVAFEVNSTDGGVLISRMDETQRDAIATPPTGLMVFNNTSSRFELYNGSEWKSLLITGDAASGAGAIWGDTIGGSTIHGFEIPYFSPSGKLISDSGFIRDSTNHSVIVKADTQMLLINSNYWGGVPTTGFIRSAYDFTAIAGFLDLSGYGSDSSELFLGYMHPVTYDRHAIVAQMEDSTIDINSLKDIDIEAVKSIDIQSENIFMNSDTVMFITSDSVIFINTKSSFDINTQDDSDYSFGVSAFGSDAECCQSSTSLFKNYKPFNMTVNAFGIGDWGMHMQHIFNESSGTDYSENSININDSRILIQANDSTFGEPAAFIRLNEWGTIDFGYGFQSYTFPTFNGTAGQVLTNDGTGALYWSSTSVDSTIKVDSDYNIYAPLLSTGGGTRNIMFGDGSGTSLNTGIYNILLGDQSGTNVDDGSQNVFLGLSSGGVITAGSDNIAIGYNANSSGDDASLSISIGAGSSAETEGTSIGSNSYAYYHSMAGGVNAGTDSFSVALGSSSFANKYAVAIGQTATAQDSSIALGATSTSVPLQLALPDFVETLKLRGTAYNWPASDATGVLTSDGSGNLTWTEASAGGVGAEIKDTIITIISDSILISNTRPQELLPQPGGGYYYDIISIVASISFNTTAYATNTALIIYCDGADYNWKQNATLLPSSISRVIKDWVDLTPIDGSLTQITENSRLMLSTFSGDPTDGDSDITLNIVYRKIPF